VLDALHAKCITKSKQKFKEQTIFEVITSHSKEKVDKELDAHTTTEKMAINVILPELKLLFFQISGERYTPSEQSSLSAKCGSEYSYNFDIKDSDSSLFAAMLTNLKLKAFTNNDDPAMFQCVSRVFQRFGDVNSLVSDDIIENIKNKSISDYTIFSGNLESMKMQLLHLEGPSAKESKFTSIPREKSKLNFLVQKGGNLYSDNVSIVDSPVQDELGEIIFEAGLNDITLSGSVRTELNRDFFEAEENTAKVNTGSDSRPRESSTSQKQSSTSSSSKMPPPPPKATGGDKETNQVFFENTEDIDGIPLRILNKTNNYEPLGSDSTLSSVNSFAYKSSTRKGYVALDIDPGEAADTSDVGEAHSSIFSGSDHTRGSRNSTRREPAPTSSRRKSDVAKKDTSTCKNAIIKKTATGGVNIAKIWVNLAAPTRLQSCQSDTEQDVNLVMVLVPAASCWIPPTVDCIKAVEDLLAQQKMWKYSILAGMMGQGLPESGKLLKKVRIVVEIFILECAFC